MPHKSEACKPCTQCGNTNPEQFSKRANGTPKSWCKECTRTKAAAFRAANPERYAQHRKNWDEANPDKRKSSRLLSQKNNRVSANTRNKRWEKYHPDACRARWSRWYAKHPEANAPRLHRRRTRITGAGGSYIAAEWMALKAAHEHRCLCCGKKEPEIKLTVDHVIPVVKGGSSNIDNIQPLCQPCNSAKGTQIIDYRGQSST